MRNSAFRGVTGTGRRRRGPHSAPKAYPSRAYEMALTAEPIDAARARELGLVNQVVREIVLDAAIDLASESQERSLGRAYIQEIMRRSSS